MRQFLLELMFKRPFSSSPSEIQTMRTSTLRHSILAWTLEKLTNKTQHRDTGKNRTEGKQGVGTRHRCRLDGRILRAYRTRHSLPIVVSNSAFSVRTAPTGLYLYQSVHHKIPLIESYDVQ